MNHFTLYIRIHRLGVGWPLSINVLVQGNKLSPFFCIIVIFGKCLQSKVLLVIKAFSFSICPQSWLI